MTHHDMIGFLKERFLKEAVVPDAAKGYVVVESFNLAIDPDILSLASRCWAREFHTHHDIDAIVGLPDAGARLVSILADSLRIPSILPAKRTQTVPGAWKQVVSWSNTSFTMDVADQQSHIGFVKPGMKILLVDDVVAYGDTAIAAIQALKAHGADIVGLCVLFDKVWQGGVEAIRSTTGVETTSLIRIEAITNDGQLQLKG